MLIYGSDTITLFLMALVACVTRPGQAKSHEQFFLNLAVQRTPRLDCATSIPRD